MTTHNTHHEESDVDTTVVEHPSVLNPTDETEASSASTPVEAEEQTSIPSSERDASSEEKQDSASSDNVTPDLEAAQQEEKQKEIEDVSEATSESVEPEKDEVKETSAETGAAFAYDSDLFAESKEEEIRPFTAFIEEFRQAEARFNASIQESQSEAFAFLATPEVASPDEINRYMSLPTVAFEDILVPISTEEPPTETASPLREDPLVEVPGEVEEKVEEQAKAAEVETEKKAPTERAVSPLLRPATRIRLPRHARHQREETVETPAPQPGEQKETAEQAASQAPAAKQEQSSAPAAEPETPRPARRYRFDRPAATANGTAGTQSAQKADTRVETAQTGSTGETITKAAASVEPQEAKQPVAQEQPVVESPPPAAEHGRRRQGHERQKEQTAPAAPAAPVTASAAETQAAQPAEIAPEDLPPLEYSELQKATSRRRRRHRTASTSTANGSAPTETPSPAAPAAPVPPARPTGAPPTAVPPFTIVSGQTVSQMNQGSEAAGPFLGPEPSPARGSTPSRDGRTTRVELQRSASYPLPTTRTHESTSTAAMHQFANIVAQSIQAQTDRMIAELRRANQAPTNVSVSLPPFPSTERVGVFVDVANLLYSARTLRLTVDFGKLLDFLRGNRRLVRAHAYCPTSPQPGEEQMFLQAVKGLGYRITTKNYKTFSSGAKKADLDLDLCMDVVRLVEGRSVDCIVLVSGDSDFMPMLDYCSDHGVRVEVAAFDEAASSTIRQSCDLFINLSMLEEIRS